jgi:hypothetical protein
MEYKISYFTEKECKKIINLHKTYKNFGFNFDWYKNTYDSNNRKNVGTSAFNAYLIPNSPHTKWIFDKLQTFFEKSTGLKFTNDIFNCQLYRYETGDLFEKHIDLVETFPKRRYNLGVNLNQNYSGGEYYCWAEDTEDDTVQLIPKNTGTICVYHSRQLHEIKEITKGVRWSLVIKIESDIINEKMTLI